MATTDLNLNVLYEDNHLIAVFKPAGILVQGDKTRDVCLMDKVKKYLKEKHKKPGNVFLGLLHRLDRPVSGVVLFAKTSKGASKLSEQFRQGTVEKTYHALVLRKPKHKKDTLINYIRKNEKENKVEICGIKALKCQRAELFYQTLRSNKKFSLLKIRPFTGRPHQIRVQLSAIGCPIMGDKKYGSPFLLPKKNIALCATSISFQMPTKKQRKEIGVKVPEEWENYQKNWQKDKPA